MGVDMGLNPISAIAGVGLGVMDTMLGSRLGLKAQHQAQDFSAQQYASRYQTQVKDLKAAGLNPMLAYQQSPGSSPQASAAPAQKSDMAGNLYQSQIATAQSALMLEQAKKTSAEKQNIEVDTLGKLEVPNLIKSQIVNNQSSAAQADATVRRIQAEIPNIEQTLKNLQVQLQKDKSNIQLNESVIKLNSILMGLRQAETFLTNQKIENQTLENQILTPRAKVSKEKMVEIGSYFEHGLGKVLKSLIPITLGGH